MCMQRVRTTVYVGKTIGLVVVALVAYGLLWATGTKVLPGDRDEDIDD